MVLNLAPVNDKNPWFTRIEDIDNDSKNRKHRRRIIDFVEKSDLLLVLEIVEIERHKNINVIESKRDRKRRREYIQIRNYNGDNALSEAAAYAYRREEELKEEYEL